MKKFRAALHEVLGKPATQEISVETRVQASRWANSVLRMCSSSTARVTVYETMEVLIDVIHKPPAESEGKPS